MKSPLVFFVAIAVLVGCGKPGREDAHEEGVVGATFEEGRGLNLARETEKALGLQAVELTVREIEPAIHLAAQVYRSAAENAGTSTALASAFVELVDAAHIREGQRVKFFANGQAGAGVIKAIDAGQKDSIGKVEVLLELEDPKRQLALGVSIPVSVRLAKVETTVIPRAAVLDTFNGKFAYVRNGEFLLRTPVMTGLESEELTEIVDGLYEGDAVASHPVETLYLIELRAVKGGGHSH